MKFKLKELVLDFFEYETPKVVLINNLKIGVLFRLVQLILFVYVIGYAIIWEKGYQEFSEIESAVTTKVKGVIYTNFSDSEFDPRIPDTSTYRRVWDTADYTVPASENNAFFVTTNVLITANQTQSSCPEDPGVWNSRCNADSDCIAGTTLSSGNGVLTGQCIVSDVNDTVKVCEIQGWCPVEKDVNPLLGNRALLAETKKFTVLIKNFVDFPDFGIKRKNIPESDDKSYLKRCRFHPETDPLCPIFAFEDIVPGDYDKAAVKGAAVAIIIDWECNFDYDPSTCYPTYSFNRLDEENASISPGLNFRYAQYYDDAQRTLYKAYGIKFIVMAQGRGGKFSIVPLLLNIGSGLGLLAMAAVLCDMVVLYVEKKRDVYKSAIFQTVEDISDDKMSSMQEVNRC